MAAYFRPLLFIFLALPLKISTCSAPKRLTKEFNYQIPKDQVLDKCKQDLLRLGYEIDIYAPETGLLVTKKKKLKRSFRRFDYLVVVIVTDKIEVFLGVEKWVFKRGSEVSTSGKSLYQTQSEDVLPVKLRKKIFQPIIQSFEKSNFKLLTP
ncbi:MAG: hypothetical protein ACE5D2_00385 [Fidelibacterota bacterium]